MKNITNFVLAIFILFSLKEMSAQTLPYLNASLPVEQRVNDLMGRMTLQEKIGQMMQVDLSVIQNDPTPLITYGIGSLLSGGGVIPNSGNQASNWADMNDTMQTYALKTRLKIPMIYGIDAVHGHSSVLGSTIFPHNIGLGCTRNPQLIKEMAKVTAKEIAATGIDWNFAPCVTVPRDERWGRTFEGFGETPEISQLLGSSAIRGYQGDSLCPSSILACSKHFLADGGTTGGVDQGNAELDEAEIRKIFLPGYISAIDSGVGSIMISHSSINGLRMHGNKYWVTDVLKNELGFKGIVVSDFGSINRLDTNYKKCVEIGINSGLDMVMIPYTYQAFYDNLLSLVNEGKISAARIDDAVRRILTIKFKLGLFEKPFTDRTFLSEFGSAEHRAVARQCVRESLVLLKKKDGILPIRKTNCRILVAGSNANNIGNQCGGWTLSWQGINGPIGFGTSILQGIRNIAPSAQVDFSSNGNFTDTKADYSVVIIGETPYAEYFGDRSDLSIPKSDIDLIKKMKSYGAPVIVILVSGRPLIINKILHFADVIAAAWLPGTEGDGIAEVLFGNYQPKGKLSHSWPKNMSQIPINIEDKNYDPLYEYGYGISSLSDSPAGSAPVCLSSIITSDGKHIELTFNKTMKDPSSSQSKFNFTHNNSPITASTSLSLKQNDNTTIIIELDKEYYKRDELGTVSFVSGKVESQDGGLLQPFNTMDAVNWARPATVAIPGRIEAENYSQMSGIEIESTDDIDGESNITNAETGDWLEYYINVPLTGSYNLNLRIANDTSASQIQFLFNKTTFVTKSIPVTGSLHSWKTVQYSVKKLEAGEQPVEVRILNGVFKLNWFSIENTSSAVDEQSMIPLANQLDQNYPNPFNPETIISYQLSTLSKVELKVYDILGRNIATLIDKEQNAGRYKVKFNGSNLPSGTYLIRLHANNYTETKKIMLIK